jgi:hypothetical protein
MKNGVSGGAFSLISFFLAALALLAPWREVFSASSP